jgi:hypothetical protein
VADQTGGNLHPERIPGAETATAHEDKFINYLVDPDKPKAAFFEGLGYDESNWEDLRDTLLAQLPGVPGRYGKPNGGGGYNYTAIMTVTGPRAAEYVKTTWAVNPEGPPHLVTVVKAKPSEVASYSE